MVEYVLFLYIGFNILHSLHLTTQFISWPSLFLVPSIHPDFLDNVGSKGSDFGLICLLIYIWLDFSSSVRIVNILNMVTTPKYISSTQISLLSCAFCINGRDSTINCLLNICLLEVNMYLKLGKLYLPPCLEKKKKKKMRIKLLKSCLHPLFILHSTLIPLLEYYPKYS